MIHVGSEGLHVWSDPTDKLLLKWPSLMNQCDLLHHMDGQVCVFFVPGEHMAPGCTKGSWWRQCVALENVLLRNLGSCHPYGC